MTTRAVIYCRISEDREDDNLAVDRQEESCRKLVEREGWELTQVYREKASASSRRVRKVYRQLLADLQAGAFDAIVVWAQDRLVRKVEDMIELIPLCEERRVGIHTVQAGMVDLSTPGGQTMALIAAVMARGEVKDKAARQRAQQRQAAQKGEASGRRAFGYRLVDGAWVEHPAEAAVVRDAFRRLLEGGESLVEITRAVSESGLVSAAQSKPWTRRSVRYMLLSPRYCGVREYRRGQQDAIVVKGSWPQLITEEQHEAAVKLLTDPIRTTTTGNARKHIGSGLYRCGCSSCGGTKTVRTLNRKGGVRVYACQQYHLARSANPVDAIVLGVVEGYLARPDGPASFLAAQDVPEIAVLRTERDRLEREIEKYRDQLKREVIEEDDFLPLKREAQAAISVIDRKLASAARASQLVALGSAPDPVAAFRNLSLTATRKVIDALMVVTLMPAKSSSPVFDPDAVQISWK